MEPLKSPNLIHDLLYSEVTASIRQAAFNVHCELGSGYLEKVYENALAHEFQLSGLNFRCQVPIRIFYKGTIVGEYIADFIVEDQVIVELKAVAEINRIHMAQTLNYLKGTRKKLGVLINFGNPKLQFKRIAL